MDNEGSWTICNKMEKYYSLFFYIGPKIFRTLQNIFWIDKDSCLIILLHTETSLFINSMAIRVVEFSNGGTKLERFLPKNQHTQRKLFNFENWVSGEVSTLLYYRGGKPLWKTDSLRKFSFLGHLQVYVGIMTSLISFS